jgi:hypothetical protein
MIVVVLVVLWVVVAVVDVLRWITLVQVVEKWALAITRAADERGGGT